MKTGMGDSYFYGDDFYEMERPVPPGERKEVVLDAMINEMIRNLIEAGNQPPFDFTYSADRFRAKVRATRGSADWLQDHAD